jgi:hypothetical protein
MYVISLDIHQQNMQKSSIDFMHRDTLLRCTLESLSIFGENTKAALLTRLETEGIGFTSELFDINKFCSITEELLGRSAEFIFIKILDDFAKNSHMSLEEIGLSEKPCYRTRSGLLVSLYSKTSA